MTGMPVEGAVEEHVANIFTKLDLPVSENEHRRVVAVWPFFGALAVCLA